ncbi:hypothetical protein [Flavobacterium sp. 25HG05S-40]|uniref:hypothetical protein n=1 Tax=Flavobacterium sp. 25HG05S-40 TaxID=3458682 RepID=UPI004044987A
MEHKEKNYGCLAVIVILVVGYVVLSVFVQVTETLVKVLENPFINYSIPVLILLVIHLRTKNEKKDK